MKTTLDLSPEQSFDCFKKLNESIKITNLPFSIYCSFLQIYNEKIYDLLQVITICNPGFPQT